MRIKKTLLIIFFSCFTILAFAQNISSHIPKRATYVVAINPATHVGTGDVTQINQMEMFTRNNEYDKQGYNFLYGDEYLDEKRQEAFKGLFKTVFTDPVSIGVDTSRLIFIFTDTPDSVHYWAYLLPLNNGNAFGEYVCNKLYKEKKTADKGSGFSFVNDERLAVGWTNSYAIILLADYYYLYESTTMSQELQQYRILDSTAKANQMIEEMALRSDSTISDSIRNARTERLLKAAADRLEEIEKDTIPVEDSYNYYDDNIYNWTEIYEIQQVGKDSLIKKMALHQLKKLMNLNYEESVESVPQFRAVQNEKYDAMYWYNYGELMQQSYMSSMLSRREYISYSGDDPSRDTSQIHNMWEGSYVASIIRFEGNVASMEQRMYFTDDLRKQTQGLYSGRVSRKMFHYVRGENLMGFVAMSVDVEKFMKFYGAVYREYLINSSYNVLTQTYLDFFDLAKIFVDEKTLYNMFNGELLFAVTDLKPYTASYITYDYDENFNQIEVRKERTEVRPEFIMLAGVGEAKKMQELIDIMERMNVLKKQNSQYYLMNTPGEYDVRVFLALHNGMLIITNNEELMQKKLKHGYKRKDRVNGKLRRLGRRSPLVAYWNGQKSIELMKKTKQNETLSEEDKESLTILEQQVNNGVIIGRRSKGDVQRIEMRVELNTTEEGKKQTSFVRFFHLLNSLYLVRTNSVK
jgi:Domain of unknown function (DUF4836)